MERIESPSFFFSLPFHLLLIFVSSQRGATNLSIHFFPQTSLSKRRITKNYTQNWFSRIKTTPILASLFLLTLQFSSRIPWFVSPLRPRDDKNCEILHEPAKPYLSTRMRNERERKRELKSFPPTTWVAKPLELPLRSLSLLNKTLGETHSPSANSESPTSKSFLSNRRVFHFGGSADPSTAGCKRGRLDRIAHVFSTSCDVWVFTRRPSTPCFAPTPWETTERGSRKERTSKEDDEGRGRRRVINR